MATGNRTVVPSRKGLRRLWQAWKYSLAGLGAAWRQEPSFRQEVILVFILAPVGLWLGESAAERVLLVGSLFLVLIIELLNSAVETIVNRFGEEIHPLSGQAKDLGSAAVLIALVNAGTVWLLIWLT